MMMNRPMNRPMPQPGLAPGGMRPPKAKIERGRLLQYITEISFVLNDLTLYLDTHCTDEDALNQFFEYNEKRKEALKDYSRWYGPLVLSGAAPSDSWQWACQPMPWEGGNC